MSKTIISWIDSNALVIIITGNPINTVQQLTGPKLEALGSPQVTRGRIMAAVWGEWPTLSSTGPCCVPCHLQEKQPPPLKIRRQWTHALSGTLDDHPSPISGCTKMCVTKGVRVPRSDPDRGGCVCHLWQHCRNLLILIPSWVGVSES